LLDVPGLGLHFVTTSALLDEVVLTSGFECVLDTGMLAFALLARLLPAERGFSCETTDDTFFWLLSDATTSFD